MIDNELTRPGAFVLGANYWASHAGTRMWSDWDRQVVADDLAALAAAGLQILRVFPLWPDFQPLEQLYGGGGSRVEFRFGEDPLPDTRLGRCGLSESAMEHFGELCGLAEQCGLRLLVGLLTGWMSGRLYLPPGLQGRNPLVDPVAIEWELRFVRGFVESFRESPAVIGWDLGNECNCLGSATREQAAVWTATIANAIRAADPTRPVVSGMHSLSPSGAWTAADQGEWTDLLCTHPYPVFTPHCDQDPVNTQRTGLHGTAESRFYADLGGQPCLCQEIGTLGPMIASERVAADFVRASLYSLWANDCHGLVWWCAHEQAHLAHAPYDWCAVERELGLLRADRSPKPVLEEMTAFRAFLDGLPCSDLPAHSVEAVCLLTQDQDHWGVAYSSYILAKQAGFDLRFAYVDQPLPDSDLYLLPCLSGHRVLPRRLWLEILDRTAAGATLYLSLADGLPSGFEPVVGLEPQSRERRREREPIVLAGVEGQPVLPAFGSHKVRILATRAEVLGSEVDGSPAFSVAEYGRGRVFFLNLPLELYHTATPGSFHAADAPQSWLVYRHLAQRQLAGRIVTKQAPGLALTEHPLSDKECLLIAINHTPARLTDRLRLAEGWLWAKPLRGGIGAEGELSLPANEAAVLTIERL